MTREDYVRALQNIRGIVEGDTHIPTDTYNALIAEIDRAVSAKPAKRGRYNLCSVCNHTPGHCDC